MYYNTKSVACDIFLWGERMKKEEHLGYYFKCIHDAFVARANAQLRDVGVTALQRDVLLYLFRHKGEETTQRELEQFFHLSHTTVIGLLRRMEEKKLVRVTVNARDRRQRNVELLEKAEKIEQGCMQHQSRTERLLSERLTAEERAQLVRLLYIVYEALTEDRKEGSV